MQESLERMEAFRSLCKFPEAHETFESHWKLKVKLPTFVKWLFLPPVKRIVGGVGWVLLLTFAGAESASRS